MHDHTRTRVGPSLGTCRDCGTTEDMYWWDGKPGYVKAGGYLATSAVTRCRPCYNLYCKYRQVIRGRYVFGPPKPARPKLAPTPVTCTDCGRRFVRTNQATRCADCGVARRKHSEARRRSVMKVGDLDITWRTVGDRDAWTCHLCLRPVIQAAGTADMPNGATVDHLVPIADGGDHVWSNVALAHRICNVRRGTSGVVQLRLVG